MKLDLSIKAMFRLPQERGEMINFLTEVGKANMEIVRRDRIGRTVSIEVRREAWKGKYKEKTATGFVIWG